MISQDLFFANFLISLQGFEKISREIVGGQIITEIRFDNAFCLGHHVAPLFGGCLLQ